MKNDITLSAFLLLVKAGLWEKDIRLLSLYPIDFKYLYQLAEEQSVVGLIAAGLEHVEDMTLAKQQVLPYMKQVISLESRNAAMNKFIESLYEKLNEAGIQALLVKGQGIAQCYERPQWRSAGDVDLFVDTPSYDKAKQLLLSLASSSEKEDVVRRHLGMSIGSWCVELHGTLHCNLSRFVDKQIDRIQQETFAKADFRVWQNGNERVLLPGADDDVIFVFAHILQHFFRYGIGLRQLCVWTRLLWAYRETIDKTLLTQRIGQMHLMTEWKAFSAFVVDYLGMPVPAMPLYDSAPKWSRKASRISSYILEVGNFGHNRQSSYKGQSSYLARKAISFRFRLRDFFLHFAISPITSLRVFGRTMRIGVKAVVRGE